MPVDVYTTADHAVILAAVPGMVPADLDLSIHQNTVTMSGTVPNARGLADAKKATWYVAELGRGTYRRTVTLPFAVDPDQASASVQHGIVRVVLLKAESAGPRTIARTQKAGEVMTAMAVA
jgi:HSP20 family protein